MREAHDVVTGESGLVLRDDGEGLALVGDGVVVRPDFGRMAARLRPSNLSRELLVRAAKVKHAGGPLTAVDATAGLGDDSLLLAAAGFEVRLYERNPTVAALLRDALWRAQADPRLSSVVARMTLVEGDSVQGLAELGFHPSVVLLDPMFPAKQKSAAVKKKLQLLQQLEAPCDDEAALLEAALSAKPRKVVVKRPAKGPFLAGAKPSYSLEGKAIRYDCYVVPSDEHD